MSVPPTLLLDAMTTQLRVTSATIRRAETTPTAISLGPLTTVFTPPPGCEECFEPTTTKGPNPRCTAYYTDCYGQRACMPVNAPFGSAAFHSPGLFCPAGWTTATVLTADMSDGNGETSAFCCPTGFTYTSGQAFASTTAGPQCILTMYEGEFSYRACDAEKNEELRTVAIGTSVITSVLTWTSTTTDKSWLGPETVSWSKTTWTMYLESIVTTQAKSLAGTLAPAVQLVWRPSDLPQTTNAASSATTAPVPSKTAAPQEEAPLAMATIVGIAVGAVAFTAILVLVILYLGRRRRRGGGDPGTVDATGKPPGNDASISGETGGLEPGQKPELDATATLQTNKAATVKQELPAESVIPRPAAREPQAFELDAAPVVPELPAKEGAAKVSTNQKTVLFPAGGAQTALRNPNPVSPVSDGSPSQPPHAVSPPSVLSSVGGHNSHTVEGWRASIIE